MEPRRITMSALYNGVNVTTQLAPYLNSFTYTDVASGESDSINIVLNDRDRKWIGPWFPYIGDEIQPTIQFHNWREGKNFEEFPCGMFHVDDFSFRGGPIHLNLEGTAIPTASGFKTTKRTETYEAFTLQEIGQIIASRSGVALYYEADPIYVEKVEQSNTTDCEFFNKLVKKYGLALKIYNDRLVVFAEDVYEFAPAKLDLTEADIDPNWSWNNKSIGIYDGVRYEYSHSDKNCTFYVFIGDGPRMLYCNEAVGNLYEAVIVALAALNEANREMTTMTIKIKAHPGLIATDCVNLELGNLSGKYYIEKIRHNVGDGYDMELDMRRLEVRYVLAERYDRLFGDGTETPESESENEDTETPEE